LEKEGRSSTTIFEGFLSAQEANAVVATVNGTDIVNRELDVSIEQFSQMALSQQVDITNESIQSEIRTQAIEVLVNTELLKQEAASRGISISTEEASARLESITEEIGGEEVLGERMATLGIDRAQLQQDIREELLIQSLLDQVFVEAAIEVTDEEIAAVYEGAGGGSEGFPALEEVVGEVRAQITASKEQQAIDTLLLELRSEAEIEIVE
jgi:FKBP-type peptidyl-prolyl cis-trans isomerase (trigger factor)